MIRITRGIWIFALAVSLGCSGPSGPPTYPVSGEVTFNGEPVATGTILFEPFQSDGTLPASGQIIDGKFNFEIEKGDKKVKVFADREVGDPDPVMGARRRENYIPAKYNDRTELFAEVTTDGTKNTYSYPLEGK